MVKSALAIVNKLICKTRDNQGPDRDYGELGVCTTMQVGDLEVCTYAYASQRPEWRLKKVSIQGLPYIR